MSGEYVGTICVFMCALLGPLYSRLFLWVYDCFLAWFVSLEYLLGRYNSKFLILKFSRAYLYGL